MQDFIADKELSDANHISGMTNTEEPPHTAEGNMPNEPVRAVSNDEHEEGKPKRTFKKGEGLRLDGPVAKICTLERGAAYVGLTKVALRNAMQRGQMPGHKTRTNPEDEGSDGIWWFNVKAWDALADELPELEPPEWHHWKDYWTYDRGSRKFQQVKKEDCVEVEGKRIYKPRKSKLEQAKNL
ncbi:transcriptional regulator [Salmonella enterica subsp. enterica serovar Ball]|nr:transcriptional regulator [Salmonella enterica subsp. enterica serovar Minnesota]ECI4643456.1 transcriptional regulator [Salmonella enterica subsp. salamae]EDV5021650.1 transcriptional regulator [Salmonella enterica subsp. enterica serovar Ball]